MQQEEVGRTVEEEFASCNLASAASSVCKIASSQEQAMASPPPSPSCWPSPASVSSQTPSPNPRTHTLLTCRHRHVDDGVVVVVAKSLGRLLFVYAMQVG